MPAVDGRRIRLSPARRLICDLMAFSRGVPVVTFERTMDLSAVAAARKAVDPPPAWVLLFTKAFAVVAARRPELRRVYLPLPVPHLWESDESVASVAVERDYGGEPAVLFGRARSPDRQPIAELMSRLAAWKSAAVGDVPEFNRVLRYARLPLPVRRALWTYALCWSGRIRTRNFGTYGVSFTGAAGGTALNLCSPMATTLTTGVFAADGTLPVRLHFDHRVFDGVPAANALADIERVMNGEIADELRAMAGDRSTAAVGRQPRQ